jgi:hypothetical protein
MGERLGRKDFLPVEPKASLLPLSPRQTLGSPKTTPLSCPAAPYPSFDTRGRPSCSRVPFAAKTFYAPRFAQVPPTSEVFRQVDEGEEVLFARALI